MVKNTVMKICTSIEQSDHLYNVLKIDYKTSDCVHVITRNDCREDWKKLSQDKMNTWLYPRDKVRGNLSDYMLPAWSLTALLALMPKIKFFKDEDAYEPCISRYGDKYICHYNCGGADEHWYIEDNPIDAAYNMVCWLKENNKI